MNFWQRLWGHLKTVCVHRHNVLKNCIRAGIIRQGFAHDLSKFSPVEFMAGVRFFQGFRSPNEGEREKYGYSLAWMHHKGRNKHHYEYWTDYDPVSRKMMPVKMPVKYVAEMFCDRVAASKTYKKQEYTDRCSLDYYNARKDQRDLHPETAKLLEKLLIMLAEEGEGVTFAYIRKMVHDARKEGH